MTSSGSESRILDCSFSLTYDDSLREITSINCLPGEGHGCLLHHVITNCNIFVSANCQDGDVQLVGGLSAHEGTVEVCIGQRWGTVCDNYWSTSDGQVVCRQLGYSTEGIILHTQFFT